MLRPELGRGQPEDSRESELLRGKLLPWASALVSDRGSTGPRPERGVGLVLFCRAP
jgi:hypothetical protein